MISLFDVIEEEQKYSMKVALIKIGCRLAYGALCKSGGVQEALSIIKILNEAGIKVDVYDKQISSDTAPDNPLTTMISIDEYKEVNNREYDCLIILNGNTTYFGGEDRPQETKKIAIMSSFVGKVFYVIGDFNLLMQDYFARESARKPWLSNYDDNLRVTRNDVIYITQGKNTDLQVKDVNSLSTQTKVEIAGAEYFPIEKFPMFTLTRHEMNTNPEYDIIYGGNFRGGRREEDMVKYLFGYPENIRVKLFGKLSLDNFTPNLIKDIRPPKIVSEQYDYFTYCEELHKSKSIVIIGDGKDKQYNKIAARVYEAIMMGVVLFVDVNLDPNKTIFTNSELNNFCYVYNREDIIDRLKMLEDDDYRKHIVDLQYSNTYVDFHTYALQFKDILTKRGVKSHED